MLRGIQKNMIQVQTPKSRYFETAYFIMRAETSASASKSTPNEMLNEANRILAESNLLSRKDSGKPHRLRGRLYPYFCGVLTGASLIALVWLAVLLFL